jgi:hypothetical protein
MSRSGQGVVAADPSVPNGWSFRPGFVGTAPAGGARTKLSVTESDHARPFAELKKSRAKLNGNPRLCQDLLVTLGTLEGRGARLLNGCGSAAERSEVGSSRLLGGDNAN